MSHGGRDEWRSRFWYGSSCKPTLGLSFTSRRTMRIRSILLSGIVLTAVAACLPAQRPQALEADVRREIERVNAENAAAFKRWDVAGIMALRAPDFHTITPDGRRSDRAAMETYITGLLNGIRKWNDITVTIDSLTVVGDTAVAIVRQYLDRMALRPDNQVHHVQTWVTQRETWIRSGSRWLLWRVDQLHDQRRLVDGKPQ
ncbi:MAG: nuclear transport factor 2 family protein, partial [Gemmatimonadaceae bacterium]